MLIKFADALKVEVLEIFGFRHEVTFKDFRDMAHRFVKDADEEKLRMAIKVLRAVLR
jgi:hypothetical protein